MTDNTDNTTEITETNEVASELGQVIVRAAVGAVIGFAVGRGLIYAERKLIERRARKMEADVAMFAMGRG